MLHNATFTLSTLSLSTWLILHLTIFSFSHLPAQEHTQVYIVCKRAILCVSGSSEEIVRSNLHQILPMFIDEQNNAVNINNVKQLQLFTWLSERDGQRFIQSQWGELSFSYAHLFNMVKGLIHSLNTFWSQVHHHYQYWLCSCGGVCRAFASTCLWAGKPCGHDKVLFVFD